MARTLDVFTGQHIIKFKLTHHLRRASSKPAPLSTSSWKPKRYQSAPVVLTSSFQADASYAGKSLKRQVGRPESSKRRVARRHRTSWAEDGIEKFENMLSVGSTCFVDFVHRMHKTDFWPTSFFRFKCIVAEQSFSTYIQLHDTIFEILKAPKDPACLSQMAFFARMKHIAQRRAV